MSMAA